MTIGWQSRDNSAAILVCPIDVGPATPRGRVITPPAKLRGYFSVEGSGDTTQTARHTRRGSKQGESLLNLASEKLSLFIGYTMNRVLC